MFSALQVRMEMHNEGILVAFAVFDGRDSTKDSWLNIERLYYSSWEDVQDYAAEAVTMSVIGEPK